MHKFPFGSLAIPLGEGPTMAFPRTDLAYFCAVDFSLAGTSHCNKPHFTLLEIEYIIFLETFEFKQ